MHPPRVSGATRQRGAALLLLLLVLGMGASSLLINAFQTSNDRQRELRTAAQLAEAREALLGFAMINGRLPRPAASATDGREASLPCGAAGCTGYLPWVTLGVSATDAWGKRFRYSVSADFTNKPVVPSQAVANQRILGRSERGVPFYLVGADLCTIDTRCAPVVLVSSGNHNLGTSEQGILLANGSSGNTDELQNNNSTNAFFSRQLSRDPQVSGGEFDDQVSWIPLQLLYRRMEAAGVFEEGGTSPISPPSSAHSQL